LATAFPWPRPCLRAPYGPWTCPPIPLASALGTFFQLDDIIIYIFGPWFWTLGLRWLQGRPLLARTGKRTLVLGDTPWVSSTLENYVSKLFPSATASPPWRCTGLTPG
jgi:hypothetical protein